MAFQPGATLGPYEILSLIGAGGMGEVYRARDPRLNRDVAIKVLPADRVSDGDRRRRFVQEAHAASALNHPHIVTIHEIESVNGRDFIVMEYVRGKSLDKLIPRRGMPLGDVLRIGIAVADALAAAHARGIIHRDLKPANVVVADGGAIKVLDFGLAKLIAAGVMPEEEAATISADQVLSTPGAIAGTAAYMSPEQAAAEKVDPRSDIFSFGAMLYEMATGARAFAGVTVADTLRAVRSTQPNAPTTIAQTVPGDLEKVILRCLRKDRDRRFQHIDDVKVALQEIKEETESSTAPAVPRAHTLRPTIVLGTAGTIVIAATAAWLWWPDSHTKAPPARVLPLTTLRGHESWPTFSPDGSQIAFTWSGDNDANDDIYVKFVGSAEVRRLTSDPQPDYAPSWSPDGRQVAYLRKTSPELQAGTVHVLSALGGSDLKLSDLSVSPPLAWSANGGYLAARRMPAETAGGETGIYLIPVRGGAPRPLTRASLPRFDAAPAFSPDGRRLAYASCDLWRCDGQVIDLNGDLEPVATPKKLWTTSGWNLTSIAWARDGKSVIYPDYLDTFVSYLWRVSVEGGLDPERIELAGAGAIMPATLTAKDHLAFARRVYDMDVYRFESGQPARPVLTSTFAETEARLSPDGRRIAFCSARSGDQNEIWIADANGGSAQQLTRGPGSSQGSPSWSPDGRRLAFDSLGVDFQWHIWIIDAEGGTPHQLTTHSGNQHVPSWSRDGQWIYFSAEQGKGQDIWRVPISGGSPVQITRGGSGKFASETAGGDSLLYQPKESDSALMIKPLRGGPTRQLVACVKHTAFGAGQQGVYYVPCDASSDPPVHLIDPATGRDRRLGTLQMYENSVNAPPLGLSISPDGRSILYLRHMTNSADLMLIENFR